ncbi:MAG TPA: cupin domain-containing protein, partial [Opitutaceae bacterium]|nr:cupin domain-containing protein [Opitutaceae bacterium]
MTSDFIGSGEWVEFRDAFLRRETKIVAPMVSTSRFASLWADWVIEAVGCFTNAPDSHDRFRLVSRGRTLPPALYTDRQGHFSGEAFRQLIQNGASLALGNFENYLDPVLALSRRFEAELRCPVQVNLYVTPPGNQGLGTHVDPHDVLILQLRGEKRWIIHAGSEIGDPSTESILRAGGWLYLPKGVRHEVRNEGVEPSVHLTLGFHPLTWGEVFERALHRARVANPTVNARLLAGDEEVFTPDAMLVRLQSILPFVNLPDHRGTYYANFANLALPVPNEAVVTVEAIAAIGADSPVVWRPEAVLSVGGGRPTEVTLPYRRHPLVFQSRWGDLLSALRAGDRV